MWRRCAAAWMLLALFVSGCASGGPSGASPPSVKASASAAVPASASASPSATPSPALATPFVSSGDEAGAYAFVKAYFAELDRVFASGDTAALAPYRIPTCICIRVEKNIRDVYDLGGRITGARLTILKWAYGNHGPAFARTAIYFYATPIVHHLPGKPDATDRALYGD